MNRFKVKQLLPSLMILLCVVFSVQGQSTSALRINEVLINNTNGFVDQFGNRGAWVEVYNSSAGTVEMAGCYLTDDPSNPKKYMISKGDISTKIKPRQWALIWADGQPHHGVFHTNFVLDTIGPVMIQLFDASGKKMIDQVQIPTLQSNQSYGRLIDGGQEFSVMDYPTPSVANFVQQGNPKVERFEAMDSLGIGMAVTAMFVVFIALLLLFLVFKYVGKTAILLSKRRAGILNNGVQVESKDGDTVSGEVIAAIGMALSEMENDLHDYQETVLTIKKVTRNYSPWSSKLYGLRENPHRK